MKPSVFALAALLLAAAPAMLFAEVTPQNVRITVNGKPVDAADAPFRLTINGKPAAAVTKPAKADKADPPAAKPLKDGAISYEAAKALVADGALLLDVRTAKEYSAKHADGAELLPLEQIETDFARRYPNRERTVVFYCRSGRRSGMAMKAAQKLGYGRVYNLGSYKNWKGTFKGSDAR